MVLSHLGVSILGGIITIIISYLIFRKKAVSIWGFVASFLPDTPVFLLATLGATGLGNVMIITHSAGIFIFPLVPIIADVLLIEFEFVRNLSWLPFPSYMKTLKKIDTVIDTLEKYYAIPRPIRVNRVFFVGLLAGVIHLAINVLIGSL